MSPPGDSDLPRDSNPDPSQGFKTGMLSVCLLVAVLFAIITLILLKKYYSNLNNPRSRTTNIPPVAVPEDGQEGFMDEDDQGPILDNPIWYIRTVGLQQSVIDSISVFKFKKDEVLVEGTDCSVCLNEFQEDETLRLLPKCSHAFHISCIDTWLRSHKNCPLCRAPIVCNNVVNASLSPAEPNLNEVESGEDTRVENSANYGGEDETVELGIEGGANTESLAKVSSNLNTSTCRFQVLSDLAHHNPNMENPQPARRSVSMDDSEALRIYLELANMSIPKVIAEGCSSTSRRIQSKKPSLQPSGKRVENGSSSKKRMVKSSSSIGSSLTKGCVAMKRSFSSTRKVSPPRRHCKSQDSILPL